MRKLLFLLFATLIGSNASAFYSSPFDYFSDCCCSECGSLGLDVGLTFGYRRDRISTHTFLDTSIINVDDACPCDTALPATLIISDKLSGLKIWEIGLEASYTTCNNFYFCGNFNYGWITEGHYKFKEEATITMPENTLDPIVSFTRFDADRGHVYDFSLCMGYQFRPCWSYGIAITPAFGYSWHGQTVKIDNGEQLINRTNLLDELGLDNPGLGPVFGNFDFRYRWNGPWIGINLAYQMCCDWSVFVDYEYHWAYFHMRGNHPIFADADGTYRGHSKRAYGEIFDLGINWYFCSGWNLTLVGQLEWWHAKHGKTNILITEDANGDIDLVCYNRLPLDRVKWDSSSIRLTLGTFF